MKRIALVCLALMCTVLAHTKNQELFGRSLMLTRPADAHLAERNHSWHQFIYAKHGNWGTAFQIIPFFHHTIKHQKNGRYFLINDKNKLLIAGDNTLQAPIRDVRGEWLGLQSNFVSTFSLIPSQQQFGAIVEYNQNVYSILPYDFFENWQVGFRFPILVVENRLDLKEENILNPSATGPANALQAFNSPTRRAQRMQNKQSRVGVGDLDLYMESAYLAENSFLLSYRSGVTIPTGNKNDPTFLFDPVLGNNHRIGIHGAVDFQLLLNRDPSVWAACFFMSLESHYFLRVHQKRTFDLKEKEWSKFLLFNVNDGTNQRNIPGVNILTRSAHVRPQTMAEFACGWRFINRCFSAEFGYTVWGRDSERIKELEDPFPTIYGIAAPQSVLDPVPKTASTSTISTLGPTDAIFVPITAEDIDLESGAAGSALSHTFYTALDWHKHGSTIDGFFSVGGFAEWAQKNASLSSYGIWTKIGATF